MPEDTICKTVRQYSQKQLSSEDMEKLMWIAESYRQVKNEVYTRYGGIGGLTKLYPGYTVQNEMTKTGLRQKIDMPAVYFYLAIFDALGDIKSQWARTKSKLLDLIGRNETMTKEEKHYLRFLLKTNTSFCAVLQKLPAQLPQELQRKQEELAVLVNTEKLHRYLRRQVRKYHTVPHTDMAEGFFISERAYRYGDHGIYISTKEKRRRIFVPLTDSNRYSSQMYIKLYPEEYRIEIHVPVEASVIKHEDYQNIVGVAMGMNTMLTTDQGNCYGINFGALQDEYTEWVREQTISYNRNRADNPGRKKYNARKNRYEERLHSYINHELNSFLKTEKPCIVYTIRMPKAKSAGKSPRWNHAVAMWQRGYIRKRLTQKCRENSVELIEVLGKDVSKECSCCGAAGSKSEGRFNCNVCGYSSEEKINTARNVKKRGLEGKIIRTSFQINTGTEPGFYQQQD